MNFHKSHAVDPYSETVLINIIEEMKKVNSTDNQKMAKLAVTTKPMLETWLSKIFNSSENLKKLIQLPTVVVVQENGRRMLIDSRIKLILRDHP